MANHEVEEIFTEKISCTGDTENGISGHPLIWLRVPKEKGEITCPYCEKKFVLKNNA